MSDRLLVASRKGLFTIDRAAAGWAVSGTSFLGDRCTIAIHDARNGALYAALDHGHFGVKLHRSRDGGGTWQEIAAPAFPAAEDEGPDAEGGGPGEPEASPSVKLLWCLEPGGADEGGVLWAGTIPGGLFRSEDGGEHWQLNRPLWDEPLRQVWFGGGYADPGIHSVCVDPRDSRHLTVGVSCGGVWVSPDGGASWRLQADGMRADYMPPEKANDPAIQDPHLVVQCPAAPDVLWAQHHNGIFHSTDGAASWRECLDVQPSSFGFAVAVHPADPEIAWFVPASSDEHRIPVDGRVVVTRTRDGGRTFQPLTAGLPQGHAYDLTFRHALDVDETGERLAFGSTTGTLWVSEDQGDHFTCVSSHLPPIHAVRFVKPV